jgi:hypothetical protein
MPSASSRAACTRLMALTRTPACSLRRSVAKPDEGRAPPSDRAGRVHIVTESLPLGRPPLGRQPLGRLHLGRLPLGRLPLRRLPLRRTPIGRPPIGRPLLGPRSLAARCRPFGAFARAHDCHTTQAGPMAVCDVRRATGDSERATHDWYHGMPPVELRPRPSTPGVVRTREQLCARYGSIHECLCMTGPVQTPSWRAG